MTVTEAARRLTLLSLLEAAARLQVRPGDIAAKLCRDCWSTIADLELGCECTEVANTLVLSAEHWLAGAA